LGSSYVGVSQHLGNAFNGYTVAYTKGRKAVAGNVKRDFLIYPANGRNLFQVIIHLLIADNWQQFTIGELPVIFLQNGFGYIQQSDVGRYASLMSFLDNPQIAVKGQSYVFRCQFAYINIGKPGIATNHPNRIQVTTAASET